MCLSLYPAAPSDYTRTLNQVLQFTSDITTLSVFVPIIDDSDIEDVERFLANLQVDTSLFPEVVLDPTPATVDIISDDSMCAYVKLERHFLHLCAPKVHVARYFS